MKDLPTDGALVDRKERLILESRTRLLINPPKVHLDSTVPYGQAWAGAIPREPGVYVIHDLRGVLYVGRASDLRRRFDDHYWNEQNPVLRLATAKPVGTLQFSWRLTAGDEQVTLERELIAAFQPLCNRLLHAAAS